MSVFRPGLFAGKVALVTGGGTGIGKSITKELLTLGCKVSIASRNLARLKIVAEELSPLGSVDAIRCNIRDEDEVKATVASVIKKHGQLNFLVNNGGGQFPSMSQDISLKGWKAVIETNLTGTFLMSREVFNQHFDKHGGLIVNIIADMNRGFPMMSHTGAARAAVENLTKSMSVEWAESGVRVNAVAPGVIFSSTAKANYQADVFTAAATEIPMMRCGNVEEVSSAVCFLLSPGASYITGSTLRADGGSYLYSKQMVTISDHDNLKGYSWQETEEEAPKAKL